MHQDIRRLLAMALLLAGTTAAATAHAQRAASGLAPHVDLGSSLTASGKADGAGDAQPLGPKVVVPPPPAPGEKLFDDPPPDEGGWKGLARLLEAASPGVDTSIPMTPSQITDRISAMMDGGRYAEALDVIDRRIAQREAEMAMANDVQLLFLRGRALAGLERHNEAIEHYLNMTTLFPELPEPWNNLAVEYVKQGKLDMARDALQMALSANPNYAAAQANLGWVQLMQARRSFENAKGAPGAGKAAQQTSEILRR
ncbi:tetratricopeptide repeat protein [Pusillimonas sp.]|uniref:tetratricopeptide repeat protein n=1 Tax=Pusillimonas sp. TaxID=3040095 RepID=UPI0029BE089A|nr:tetratricopeptide repeat protein [Pusillimonas sp.]MDX3894233.1 tetratricopeptide repeat protein [Pusillimonas sp.]